MLVFLHQPTLLSFMTSVFYNIVMKNCRKLLMKKYTAELDPNKFAVQIASLL